MLTWMSSPRRLSSLSFRRAVSSMFSSSSWVPTLRRSVVATAAVAPPATMTGAQAGVSTTAPRRLMRMKKRAFISALSQQLVVNEIAQAMDDDAVHFLDARGGRPRHADVDVVAGEQAGDLAARAAVERDADNAALMRRLDGAHDVARIARGRDAEQHVAGLAERAHLLGEDVVEMVVVADGGDGRGIGGERYRRQPRAFALEAVQQFRGKMLRVRGRATVTAHQDLAIAQQRLDHLCRRLRDDRRQVLGAVARGQDAFLEIVLHARHQRGGIGQRLQITLGHGYLGLKNL